MNKVQSTAVGQVIRAKLVQSDNGKPFASFTIKLCPRSWNGKTFTQRVDVRSYRDAEALAEAIRPGDLVSVSGESEADVFEHNGKNYGRIVITGTLSKVTFPEEEERETAGQV